MAFAAVDTSWNTIQRPHGNLRFNVNVAAYDETPDFYPLQVSIDMPVVTADGKGKTQVRITKNVGTNQVTAFDFSTEQGLRDIHAALPAWARGAFKEAVLAGINMDVE